ncbi:phosphotransferase family protein [Microbacterium sp. 22242]|uniref:phosphotransferase family protein n=1 Tax=Microbacterium sp. 22242 TaxID=3453896 RepID=UPI003F866859
MPQLITEDATSLTTAFVDGEHGQDLIEAGNAADVLTECGRVLHRLHTLDPRLIDASAATNQTIRHGDFGPNNILFDSGGLTAVAVLDWEFSGIGDPIADIAWCEWIVRMHHPDAVHHLDRFFDAYGRRPPWADRQQEMLRRCHWLEQFARSALPDGGGAREWRRRRRIVSAWTE